MNLAEHIGGGDDLNTPTCALSVYFEGIVGALLQFTDRQNNEANCRTSAYEALSTLIGNAAMVSVVHHETLCCSSSADIRISRTALHLSNKSLLRYLIALKPQLLCR